MNPDTRGRQIRLENATCGWEYFESGLKKLRIKNSLDTCRRGLKTNNHSFYRVILRFSEQNSALLIDYYIRSVSKAE